MKRGPGQLSWKDEPEKIEPAFTAVPASKKSELPTALKRSHSFTQIGLSLMEERNSSRQTAFYAACLVCGGRQALSVRVPRCKLLISLVVLLVAVGGAGTRGGQLQGVTEAMQLTGTLDHSAIDALTRSSSVPAAIQSRRDKLKRRACTPRHINFMCDRYSCTSLNLVH